MSDSLNTRSAPWLSECCEKKECMPIETSAPIIKSNPAKRPALDALHD